MLLDYSFQMHTSDSGKEARTGPVHRVCQSGESDSRFTETPQQQALVCGHFAPTSAIRYDLRTHIPLTCTEDVSKLSIVILASVTLGDFSTGVCHWAVDNYGSKSTPLIGTLCNAFQGHHNEPWTITKRSFVNNVHKIAVGSILALVWTFSLVHGVYAKLFLVLYIYF
jgi:hypothetical protein